MTHKSAKVAERVAAFAGGRHDARYLGYFDCFNRGEYYEAHDVLEDLWLPDRKGPDGNFYKGLIQLAGAFVHVQKKRFPPAVALLRLARANLRVYPSLHHGLDLEAVLAMAERWMNMLGDIEAGSSWSPETWPRMTSPD